MVKVVMDVEIAIAVQFIKVLQLLLQEVLHYRLHLDKNHVVLKMFGIILLVFRFAVVVPIARLDTAMALKVADLL
jgi:hypothetical protein